MTDFRSLTYLDVSFNKISRISITLNELKQLPILISGKVAEMINEDTLIRIVDVRNNPIQCDCEIYNFLEFIKKENNKILFKIENLICHTPDYYNDTEVVSLNYQNFQCPIKYDNFSKNDACAGICDCWIRPFDKSMIINCGNKNLSKIPELTSVKNAPKIELYLKSNKIKEFPDIQQPGYNKIELLDLSNNLISEFDEHILNSNIQVKIYFIL